MPGRDKRGKTAIDRRHAGILLYPIAAFLHAGGLTKHESVAALLAAFERVSRGEKGRSRMQHIGHPTRYADIIAAWTRNRQFVDSSGQPRALSLTGRSGFASLVRNVSPETNARAALSVLMRYGNVRRQNNGKYKLIRNFFGANTRDAIAFEPLAYFLSDASATLAELLKSKGRRNSPEPFWRKVEAAHVSPNIASEFTAFAKERSLLFLEELDDWLEAHRGQKNVGGRRVGIGLFSVYSELDATNSNRRSVT